jgi:hypothetical protein
MNYPDALAYQQEGSLEVSFNKVATDLLTNIFIFICARDTLRFIHRLSQIALRKSEQSVAKNKNEVEFLK